MANKRPNRTRATPVRELLTGSPAIRHALELQRREDALLARVRDLLGPGARPHCLQATVKDGALTVTVDSAVWATRLRYLAPELVQGMAAIGVIAAKVRARPVDRQPNRQTTQRVPRLTATVVEHLTTAADHLSDAGIAEVFRRLAARARVRMTDPPGHEPAD
jgi:hypothetical protein